MLEEQIWICELAFMQVTIFTILWSFIGLYGLFTQTNDFSWIIDFKITQISEKILKFENFGLWTSNLAFEKKFGLWSFFGLFKVHWVEITYIWVKITCFFHWNSFHSKFGKFNQCEGVGNWTIMGRILSK